MTSQTILSSATSFLPTRSISQKNDDSNPSEIKPKDWVGFGVGDLFRIDHVILQTVKLKNNFIVSKVKSLENGIKN